MIDNFVSGYKYDPPRIAAVIQERHERGDHVYASAYSANVNNMLRSSYRRALSRGVTGVFLRDSEIAVNGGKHRRPFLQRRGTCVSRGMCRGVQTSLDVSIAENFSMLRPVEIAFGPIYTMARHDIGHDRCGSGDGAILADAARAVHDLGVATVSLFPGTSEDDQEKLACKFAAPGAGTPSSWLDECRGHVADTLMPDDFEFLLDCLTEGYAVPYAHSRVTGRPDSTGVAGLGDTGPHCRCFVGWFLNEHGDVKLESSESWGRFPAGQPENDDQTMPVDQIPCIKIKYAGGERMLAPGDVGVDAQAFWHEIQVSGEAWAVAAPKFVRDAVADGRFFNTSTPELGTK